MKYLARIFGQRVEITELRALGTVIGYSWRGVTYIWSITLPPDDDLSATYREEKRP